MEVCYGDSLSSSHLYLFTIGRSLSALGRRAVPRLPWVGQIASNANATDARRSIIIKMIWRCSRGSSISRCDCTDTYCFIRQKISWLCFMASVTRAARARLSPCFKMTSFFLFIDSPGSNLPLGHGTKATVITVLPRIRSLAAVSNSLLPYLPKISASLPLPI